MTSKDLGLVTAYAYAVSKGYTGTEEEFAELMASYATVAEEAAESAAEAAASAEVAWTSETNAASSAASAGQSATSAGNSATSALGSAVQAQSSATAAGQSATQAAGSATAAGQSATAAAGSATQAAASETAAGASATAAAGSATSASGSATAAAGSADAADASADRAQEILDSIPEDYSELSDDVADLKSAMSQVELMSSAAFITEDASETVVTISDGADSVPSKGYTFNIEPHQAGSGDPSPDNIRPITGYTSVDVTRAGKNLWNPNSYETFDLLGDGSALRYGHSYQPGTYTIINNTNTSLYYRKPKADLSSRGTTATINAGNSANVTVNAGYILWVFVNNTAGVNNAYAVMFGLDAEYEPYRGITETIPFPTEAGTVYGGTLVKNADGTGTLKVTMATVDLGARNWTRVNAFGGTFSNYINGAGYGTTGNAICANYATVFTSSDITNGDKVLYAKNNGENLYVKDSAYTDAAAFKTAMAGVQLVYELATPTTYTIPAEDMAKIPTLKGANTVWMSADGTIDLEYCADPKTWIMERITPIQTNIAYLESGNTASRAYTAGQYVIVGGQLYRVASAIASGATFTPGTNIIATTVGAELTTLNA